MLKNHRLRDEKLGLSVNADAYYSGLPEFRFMLKNFIWFLILGGDCDGLNEPLYFLQPIPSDDWLY